MIRRIAIIGAGAVGGYFGARLAEHGYQTFFVARGETLTALQRQGLQVRSPLGNVDLSPERIHACATLKEAGPVDAVVLAVKAWQVAAMADEMAPLRESLGVILPLQNGVEAPRQLAAALGADRVLGGLCRIMAQRAAPAQIEHVGAEPEILLGALDPRAEPAAAALGAAFAESGVRCVVRADIAAAIWDKMAFIASLGGIGAAARAPVGVLRSTAETRSLLAQAMHEVCAVAAAHQVVLPADLPARTLAYIDTLPAHGTSSMQRDIAAGLPSELDALVGAVARLGQAAGVDTPIFRTLHACLLPAELRAREPSRP